MTDLWLTLIAVGLLVLYVIGASATWNVHQRLKRPLHPYEAVAAYLSPFFMYGLIAYLGVASTQTVFTKRGIGVGLLCFLAIGAIAVLGTFGVCAANSSGAQELRTIWWFGALPLAWVFLGFAMLGRCVRWMSLYSYLKYPANLVVKLVMSPIKIGRAIADVTVPR